MSAGELLKAVSASLNEKTAKSLNLPIRTIKGKKVQDTIGEYYREWSAQSAHKLDLSDSILVDQFKDLLLEVPYFKENFSETELNSISKAASKKFRTNAKILADKLISNTRLSYTIREEGDSLVFVGDAKIFDRIREFVTEVTGSTYDFRPFISQVINESLDKNIAASEINITTKNIKGVDTNIKFGFDIGHVVSNVVSAYGAISINAIRRHSKSLDWQKDVRLKEDINQLYKILIDNPEAAMQAAGLDDFEVYKACVEATVGVTKRLVNDELNIALNIQEKNLDKTILKKIAMLVVDVVIPEAAPRNQRDGQSLEKSIAKALGSGSKFLEAFGRIANSNLDIMNLSSSKTGKELVRDLIVSSVLGRKMTYRSSTKVPVKLKASTLLPTKKYSIKPSAISIPKVPVPKLSRLRTTQGQFTSLVKLEALLRAGLQQSLLKNMQRPNLRNQTGRFRESVELQSLSRARDGAITAFLRYMRYPYATFEPGGKQGHKGYSPTRLIDQSVRELASTLVRERMRVVVQ